MKQLIVTALVFVLIAGLATTPLYASTSSPGANTPPAKPVSFLEAAELAAASGAYRIQNTSDITTGLIREDDKRRSAIAFGIAGLAAFAGAALWRYLPCRGAKDGSTVGGVVLEGYNKCYFEDGTRKGFDTPTKLLLGAGAGLEVVSLLYLIAHMRQDKSQDSASDAGGSQ